MSQSRRDQDGFTLIEVMISMVVFMVALLGLVALQRASIAGTNKGREHTAAVNIARYVMTQLENEAAAWPLDQSDVPSSDFPMMALGLSNPGNWNLLADGSGTVINEFRLDAYLEHSRRSFYMGDNPDTAPFCVHYMVAPLTEELPAQELFSARVRVTWPKWKQYVIEGESAGVWYDCDPNVFGPDSALSDRLKYSDVVELTGVVTREYTGQLLQ